jgi:hypothetical protein
MGEVIPVHPVVSHQKPACETLFDDVDGIAQRRLAHLDGEGLHEPQEMLLQG